MKKIKRVIILLLIILFVILLTLLIIKLKNEKDEYTDDAPQDNLKPTIQEEEIAKTLLEKSDYFTINTCIKQYLNILNIKNSSYYGYNEENEYVCLVDESKKKENIYNLLSDKYIEKNNITVNNVYDFVKTLDEQTFFAVIDMKKLQDSNVDSYAVHGIIERMKDYSLIEEIYIIVNVDETNLTFSIEPLKGEYSNIEEITTEKIEKNITENSNNTFIYSTIKDEDIAKEYINLYKKIALCSPEYMYNLLNKDYKEKRFGSLKNYKNYIKTNEKEIKKVTVDKYQVIEQENYTQYIIVDKSQNCYIFNETSPMQYSVILDTYTIDLPQFIEKYASANAQGRMALNLQKFFDALNAKDYNYAYNCLADSFKENYFTTLENFEEYAKNNFYDNMEIEYEDFKENTGMYTYKVIITNINDENPLTAEKTFIMKLKKETEFELSFNV